MNDLNKKGEDFNGDKLLLNIYILFTLFIYIKKIYINM